MKKFIAILMAAMFIMLAFAGCSGNKTPNEEKSTNEPGTVADSNAESDLAYIKDKGTLVVGVTNFAPIDYLDDNNNWTGFDAEFAAMVAEKLGVKVEFQEISWTTKETELKAKSIDCIWNGLTITPEREEEMSISAPYMKNKQVLVVKSDRLAEVQALESANGLTVVAESESAGEETIQGTEFFKDATYTAVDSQKTALMEVSMGTADACVVDYVCALGMTGEGTDYTNLSVDETIITADDEFYGIAFRKGSDVTAAVNEARSALLADGSLMQLAEKYHLGTLLVTE